MKDGVLVGILSYGSLKTLQFSPTVAVNLTKYVTFIEQVHDDMECKNRSFVMRFILVVKRLWQGFMRPFTVMFQWI